MDESLALYLRDASLRGWFNNETGELFTGFGAGPGDVVLDAGCGAGGMSGFLARSGARMIAVDVDAASVLATAAQLRQRGAERVDGFVSDCRPIPLRDATVSRVICTEVLEHVDDPPAIMAELCRVARPGALFLFTVPDPVAEGIQRRVAPDSYWRKPNHLRVFGRDDFSRLVEDAGLSIERRGSYGFYQSLWWAMFWSCGVPLAAAEHPALKHLEKSWAALLANPDGIAVKNALDDLMPKSQIIVARKPA